MTTAFDPPNADDPSADDFDPRASKPSWRIILVSIVLLLAGAITATAGFQVAVFIRFYSDIANIIPWFILFSGVSMVVLGAFLSRGRAWAAWAASVLAVLTTILVLCWNVYLIMVGVISPVNWLMLLLDGIATLTVPFTIPETLRISEIRRRLYADV
jgi:uncharacterized membrane protein